VVMVIRKVVKVGNSWMVSIPRNMCRELDMFPGCYVSVSLTVENIEIKAVSAVKLEEKAKSRR